MVGCEEESDAGRCGCEVTRWGGQDTGQAQAHAQTGDRRRETGTRRKGDGDGRWGGPEMNHEEGRAMAQATKSGGRGG